MSGVELKEVKKVKYWQNDDICRDFYSYPLFIQRGFEELKETMQLYMTNGYSPQIHFQSRFDEPFLEKFCTVMSKTQNIELSFSQAGGIKYVFGFEWGKIKILEYYG